MDLRKVEIMLTSGKNVFEGDRMTGKRIAPTYGNGYFHCWEHCKDKKDSYVLAIVEMEDGTLRRFETKEIRFLEKPE